MDRLEKFERGSRTGEAVSDSTWAATSIEELNPYTAFGSMGKARLTVCNSAILVEWPEIVRPIVMKQPVIMIRLAALI